MRRLGCRIAVLLITCAAVAWPVPAGAQTAALEGMLVQNVPAGYEQIPAGQGNGPLTPSEVFDLFGQTKGLKTTDVEGGFFRTWIKADTGDFITSGVVATTKPIDPPAFFKGFEEGAKAGGATTIFPSTAIPNSRGVTGESSLDGGGTAHTQTVVFLKKKHMFLTAIGALEPRHTPAEAIALATDQRAALGSLPEAKPVKNLAAVIGGLAVVALVVGVVIGLVVFLVRRVGGGSKPSVAAPPGPAAGWHDDPSGRYAQRYWSGMVWTEHVQDIAGNRATDPFTRTAASTAE